MYLKDRYGFCGNYGVATLVYENGKFGAGISIRNPQDPFNKNIGKTLAMSRALTNLKENPFTQIVDIESKFREIFEKMLPGAGIAESICFLNRFYDIKSEMCFRMAKEFMAREAN